MSSFCRRVILPFLVAGAFCGASAGLLFAQSGEKKNCGGDPPKGETDRTNNSNCKKCEYGCEYKDDKYKTCQDPGTGCTHEKFPDVKKCEGDLWSKADCSDKIVGTCQAARHFCK